MVTFRGAAAQWGPLAGSGAIGRFRWKLEQFHSLITFENATAWWRLARCKQKLPGVGDMLTAIWALLGCYPVMVPVPSPDIVVAAVPPPSHQAMACQATGRWLGSGTAAIARWRPRGMYKRVHPCIGDMTMSGWKPTISLINPSIHPCIPNAQKVT